MIWETFKSGLDFKGKSTRREFWYFSIFFLFAMIILSIIIIWILALNIITEGIVFFIVLMIPLMGLIVPYTTLIFRRLNDVGLSKTWFVVIAIPAIGIFVLLFLCSLPSTQNIRNLK